jgi:hypothetical protein
MSWRSHQVLQLVCVCVGTPQPCCDLERRRESHKNFIQGAARAGNGGNDRNRNTGSYQGIFDRRERRLVRKETLGTLIMARVFARPLKLF